MSDRKGSAFAGVGVAIVTPFTDGKLDVAKLKTQIEFQIDAGVQFLVPVGTTGESPTLTHDEHERVISEVIQLASGRCKVMAGTGSNCTDEALRLTRRAQKEGADASLQVAPYYNKPTQKGFYNIPGRSAKNIEPETIAKLAELPNITMVKEATGSLDQCSQILNMTNLTVLSGDDSLTLPMMSIGAEGVISVAGNIVPKDMLALVQFAAQGDFRSAAKLHHKLFPLCRDMLSLATNPIPVKGAMKLLGRDSGQLRLPMTELEESEFARLRMVLENYGFRL